MNTDSNQEASTGRDKYILALFLVIGFLDFSGTFALWSPHVFGGDMTMILTRALAGLHPEMFVSDFLFDSPSNYRFYNNFLVGFFQILEKAGVENFDMGLRVLKGFTSFIFLTGYYLLGKRVLRSSLGALLFSLACTITIPTLPGDYWGIYKEPQARVLFSAAFPFLVLVALAARTQLRLWLAAMVLAGVSFWLHPASGPPVALAVMCGMILRVFPGARLSLAFGLALISGLVFLTIIAPNLIGYIQGVANAPIGADVTLTGEVRRLRYAASYTDVRGGIWNTLITMFSGPRILLPFLGSISFILVLLFGDNSDRSDMRFFASMLLALCFISLVLPILENDAASANGEQSMQLDLVRSIRYAIPLLLLNIFWGASRLPWKSQWVAAASALLLVFWFTAKDFRPRYQQNVSPMAGAECWTKGNAICPMRRRDRVGEIFDFIRSQTPKDARFFSPEYGLSIRALARRPLAFDWKDIGWLAYSNHLRLGQSLRGVERYLAISSSSQNGDTALEWVEFGASLGADYVVTKGHMSADKLKSFGEVVFENKAASVIKINASTKSPVGVDN